MNAKETAAIFLKSVRDGIAVPGIPSFEDSLKKVDCLNVGDQHESYSPEITETDKKISDCLDKLSKSGFPIGISSQMSRDTNWKFPIIQIWTNKVSIYNDAIKSLGCSSKGLQFEQIDFDPDFKVTPQ